MKAVSHTVQGTFGTFNGVHLECALIVLDDRGAAHTTVLQIGPRDVMIDREHTGNERSTNRASLLAAGRNRAIRPCREAHSTGMLEAWR